MLDWYRANEAALKAGDFRAVQPGAEPPERKPLAPAEEAEPAPPLPPVSTPAAVPDTRMPEGAGNTYAWIAALLLAVCGGLVWLWKRQRT